MAPEGEGAGARSAPADEVALLQRVAAGDQAAFGALYDRFSGVMMAVGVKILGHHGQAEDLLHDVFLEVWRKADTYDAGRGSVRVWLCMRMRSRALDRIRSAGRAANVSIEEARLPDRPDTATDPANAPERLAVRNALAGLAEEQRVVLAMGYFGGMSSSEIAKAVGVPVGTVKSRVAAGLKKLRATLQDTGHPA